MPKHIKLLVVSLYLTPLIYVIYGLLVNIIFIPQNNNILYSSEYIHKISKQDVNTVRILATGDVMLGRTVMTKSQELGDWSYSMKTVGERLSEADITFINLENPIIENCPVHTSGFKFCSLPESVDALKYSGVDIVNLGNNHTLNYGSEGYKETIENLENNNIKYTDSNKLALFTVIDITFGFLGIDLVTNSLDKDILDTLIKSDGEVDILIAGVHWGNEYNASANQHQRNWAKALVASGVDIIIGHHPHWVQDAECISNEDMSGNSSVTAQKLMNKNELEVCPADSARVYYSLGNFVFDQMWSEETKKGLAVEFTIDNSKITKERLLPIYMNNWAQPEWTR